MHTVRYNSMQQIDCIKCFWCLSEFKFTQIAVGMFFFFVFFFNRKVLTEQML